MNVWLTEMIREDDYYGGDVAVSRESEWLGDPWHVRYADEDQIAIEWRAWGPYGAVRLVLTRTEGEAMMHALARLLAAIPGEAAQATRSAEAS